MKKPIPYKKTEEKKQINKSKIAIIIICEVIAIIACVISTFVISVLFKLNPTISAIISGGMLIVFSVFIAKKFL